jgi:hypothetical protein
MIISFNTVTKKMQIEDEDPKSLCINNNSFELAENPLKTDTSSIQLPELSVLNYAILKRYEY